VEQAGHVQTCAGGQETFFCLFCNILPCQHPRARPPPRSTRPTARTPGMSSGGTMLGCMGILPSRGVLRVLQSLSRQHAYLSAARSLPMEARLIWRSNRRVVSPAWRCPCFMRFSTKNGIPPAVSRSLREIIQHLRFPCLLCFPLHVCVDHCKVLQFLHGESAYAAPVARSKDQQYPVILHVLVLTGLCRRFNSTLDKLIGVLTRAPDVLA